MPCHGSTDTIVSMWLHVNTNVGLREIWTSVYQKQECPQYFTWQWQLKDLGRECFKKYDLK
jgi:hypothetical protein